MNDYYRFLSKVKRVIIPLPDFRFFHRASQAGDVDDKFVGRNNISAILENWLRVPHSEDDDRGNKTADCTGSYLITGYRGMGKTSFVGKVIDKLEKEQETDWYRRWNSSNGKNILAMSCMSPLLGIPVCYYLLNHFLGCYVAVGCTAFISWCCLLYVLYLLFREAPYLRRRSRNILKIKINIGNEITDIKDIFSLFAYSVKDRLHDHIGETYIKSPTNIALRLLKYLFIAIFTVLLIECSVQILTYGTHDFYTSDNDSLAFLFLKYLNDVAYKSLISGDVVQQFVMYSVGAIVAYSISSLLWHGIKKLVRRVSLYWNNRRYQLPEVYLDKISNLCERIDSSVSERQSGEFNLASSVGVLLGKERNRQYQNASVREIEYELIGIIREINKSKLLNCRFIFILDELDKLSSFNGKIGSDISEGSADLPGFTNDDNGMSEEMTVNEKRHNTLKLLSQLKYFVSTAEAKFVFIAGHELYDAYKADVSDREFSISSIFNGVINVTSFFSYDSRIKDVTRMTETYLCRHLFGDEPLTFIDSKTERGRFRLGEYRKRISTSCSDSVQQEKEIDSVMCLLKQFVTYLTFVSNGAPKKLNARFERYVISSDKFNREHNTDDSIIVRLKYGHKKVNYYLSLGYHDRQKVGFVHHMAAPIFENIISPSSDYGDKFLVSSSFLIAHIYKHHKSGFSWRNLEYLPDLIDANKTPELREFINSIIDYLGKVHLTNITSGIFTYKFPMKLAEEIAIFTKKSDELSAIFNFSLDYFSAVKKYYYRLIDFYSKHGSSKTIVSSIHHNLGDIHMANDEYTEAIIQYRHSGAIIEKELDDILEEKVDQSGDIASYIIRYARMMLKLGLAYEKRNTIDSAHMIYTRLCSRLIAYRNIDETRIGLTHYYENKPDARYAANNWQRKVAVLTELDRDSKDSEDVFRRRCYPKVIEPGQSDSFKFWMYGDQIVNNLCEFLTPDKHALVTKLSVFEDLRIAYLPILAKLLALEKHNICGITRDNIKIAEAEFQHMYIITNSVDKYLLRVDFYRKLGDIMYYKNKSCKVKDMGGLMYALDCWGYDLRGSVFNYCYRKGIEKIRTEKLIASFKNDIDFSNIKDKSDLITTIVGNNDEVDKEDVSNIIDEVPDEMLGKIHGIKDCDCRRKTYKYTSCYACKYYKRTLIHLKDNLLSANADEQKKIRMSDSLYFWYSIENEMIFSERFNELIQTALSLEAMGNVMLSCTAVPNRIVNNTLNTSLLESLFANQNDVNAFIDEIDGERSFSNADKALLYFWSAMKYYAKAGNYKESMQALTKIFNTISSYDATAKKNGIFLIFSNLSELFVSMERLVKSMIRNIAQLRMHDSNLEYQRLRRILDSEQEINMGLTSILPEIEEMLLAYYEVKLSLLETHSSDLIKMIGMFYGSPSLTYLRNDSMIYNRVISLMFKARLNERTLDVLGLCFKKPGGTLDLKQSQILAEQLFENPSMVDANMTLAFLISDSIFCLINIADVIRSSVKTTLFSDSFCYGVYKRLYYWTRWKEYVEINMPDVARLMKKYEDWFYEGHHKLMLTEAYLSGMAQKYYESSVSMHSEGSEYQSFIRNMYIMDDDLQNNTCLFYFALERMKLNSEYFKEVVSSAQCNDCYYPDNYYRS